MDRETIGTVGGRYKVLMLPWLAHGHISPYFKLARKLASGRNFSVHIYSTPANLTSIKPKHGGSAVNNVELVDFHLPPTRELPPHLHTARGLPLHQQPLLEQLFAESGPRILADILRSLKPDLIITDPKNHWAPRVIEDHNVKDKEDRKHHIPLVLFNLGAASAISYAVHCRMHPSLTYPFPEIYASEVDYKRFLRVIEAWGIDINGVSSFIDESGDRCIPPPNVDLVLFRTSRELEGKYVDYFSELTNKKVLPLGSLILDHHLDEADDQDVIIDNIARSGELAGGDADDDDIYISRWLDKKPKDSTVFVSFGSECYLSKREMDEVALGLELSGVNFIWVIRFPEHDDDQAKKMGIEEALPEGFLERVKASGRGMILEGWAPQVDILRHPSVGGFVSHCGSNSLIEGIVFGLPIIAVPMQYEQPFNARMAVGHGVALKVEITDKDGYYTGEEIARVIKRVMVEKGGDDMRARARELGQRVSCRESAELDIAIKELEQLITRT